MALSAVFVLACAPARLHPPEALLLTQGVTIEGLTPSPISEGQVFRPPFYVRPLLHNPKANYTNMLNTFVALGGRRVRVRVPGRETPLYGLITFHELPAGATGPATRSYAIQIPQSYIDDATGGRVSVVYELVAYESRSSALGWVLFLSDRPI